MGCRTRVMSDVTDPNNETTGGRGNLSFTSINLPRMGIKYGICLGERDKADMDGFYQELSDTMELVRDQLLERFEIQCSKRSYNFPFLLEQGIWTDGDKLKPTDRLRKILKHGTLTIGFIGLAETLKALIDSFKLNGIPLSTLMLTNNWNLKPIINNKEIDAGLSFNKELFHHPKNMITYLHNQGVRKVPILLQQLHS